MNNLDFNVRYCIATADNKFGAAGGGVSSKKKGVMEYWNDGVAKVVENLGNIH
jgi:hypothetical protein